MKPEEEFTRDLKSLAKEWERLGIDPDAFTRCGTCHLILKSCAFPEDAKETICKCGEVN